MKFDVKAFSLSCAITWGVGLLLLTWWIMAFDGPSLEPTWIGRIYRGYTMTVVGSIIGGIWAFFDGLIGGAVFAWLYNTIEERVLSRRRIPA
jgi:hypothetical protein